MVVVKDSEIDSNGSTIKRIENCTPVETTLPSVNF